MLTVSNALLMSSATVSVIARSGGLFWLKPVAMVLFMVFSAVLVEWLFLKPCCVEMYGMLFVMYASSVFSSAFAITDRSEMGLYDVRMLLFSDVLYMLVRYAIPSGPMCLKCLVLT